MEKYQNRDIWYHGTTRKFNKWEVNRSKNNGFTGHSAIFFTTSKDYAKNSGTKLASFSYKKGVPHKTLNMLTATNEEYEKLRIYMLNVGGFPEIFAPVSDPVKWEDAWKSGTIFKLQCLGSHDISRKFLYIKKNGITGLGATYWTDLQQKTRELIEHLISGVRALGYDILICQEANSVKKEDLDNRRLINDFENSVKSLFLVVLNLDVIEEKPDWLN